MTQYTARQITDILTSQPDRITANVAGKIQKEFDKSNWLTRPLADIYEKAVKQETGTQTLAQSCREIGYLGLNEMQRYKIFEAYEEAQKSQLQNIPALVQNNIIPNKNAGNMFMQEIDLGIIMDSALPLGFTIATKPAQKNQHQVNWENIYIECGIGIYNEVYKILEKSPELLMTGNPKPSDISL